MMITTMKKNAKMNAKKNPKKKKKGTSEGTQGTVDEDLQAAPPNPLLKMLHPPWQRE